MTTQLHGWPEVLTVDDLVDLLQLPSKANRLRLEQDGKGTVLLPGGQTHPLFQDGGSVVARGERFGLVSATLLGRTKINTACSIQT
jgi:hypothetical protein